MISLWAPPSQEITVLVLQAGGDLGRHGCVLTEFDSSPKRGQIASFPSCFSLVLVCITHAEHELRSPILLLCNARCMQVFNDATLKAHADAYTTNNRIIQPKNGRSVYIYNSPRSTIRATYGIAFSTGSTAASAFGKWLVLVWDMGCVAVSPIVLKDIKGVMEKEQRDQGKALSCIANTHGPVMLVKPVPTASVKCPGTCRFTVCLHTVCACVHTRTRMLAACTSLVQKRALESACLLDVRPAHTLHLLSEPACLQFQAGTRLGCSNCDSFTSEERDFILGVQNRAMQGTNALAAVISDIVIQGKRRSLLQQTIADLTITSQNRKPIWILPISSKACLWAAARLCRDKGTPLVELLPAEVHQLPLAHVRLAAESEWCASELHEDDIMPQHIRIVSAHALPAGVLLLLTHEALSGST
eukprot:1155964-Pelagomonas_calceolata.AAC.5